MSAINVPPVQEPVAGPSNEHRKRSRSKSSSSSSSTSSSSSSSSSPSSKRKRSRRNRRKKSKRSRHTKLRQLTKEISELRNFITQPPNYNNMDADRISVYSGVSGELYKDVADNEHLPEELHTSGVSQFTFDIETKLKEPSVPKTPENFIRMLNEIQRLGSASWSDVRYADTQKLYNHAPGFVDLECNFEVKPYDVTTQSAKADKAYAAITFCILKQKEALQNSIRNLLTWANSDSSNLENLSIKIEDLFVNGEISRISSDLLQLVCGHRSESIEVRRDAVIKHVKDPAVKMSLNKIPPSVTHIFEADAFSAALEKAGGVRRAFWPLRTDTSRRGSNKNYGQPTRGLSTRKYIAPSSVIPNPYYASGGTRPLLNSAPPSRGGGHFVNLDNYHNNIGQNLKGSFQYRGSRPRGSQRGGRGRGFSSHAPRDQYKHFEQ